MNRFQTLLWCFNFDHDQVNAFGICANIFIAGIEQVRFFVFQLKSTFHSNKSCFDEDHSEFEESASDVSLRPYLCSQSSDTVSDTQQTNSEIQSNAETSLSSLPSYNEVVLKGGHYQKGRRSLLLLYLKCDIIYVLSNNL